MGTQKEYERLLRQTSTAPHQKSSKSAHDVRNDGTHLDYPLGRVIPRSIKSQSNIIRLQQVYGNQAVMRMLKATPTPERLSVMIHAPSNVVSRLTQAQQQKLDKINAKISALEVIVSILQAGHKVIMLPALIADSLWAIIKRLVNKARGKKGNQAPGNDRDESLLNQFTTFAGNEGAGLTLLLNGYTPQKQRIAVDWKLGSFKPLDLRNILPWNVLSLLARPFSWKIRSLKKQAKKITG